MSPDSNEDGASTPTVTIIVVSYNTREMTLECLRSVRDQTTIPYELIVMDNDSKDGSAEAIAAEFPDINLMAEKDNHGFAKANNIVAKIAKGEYVLLLNPDTIVLDGAIDNLIGFAKEKPDAMIWGGRTLYGDRSLNPTNCWRKMSLWSLFCRLVGLSGLLPQSGLFNPEAYGGWRRDTEQDVDIVTGCLFLMKRRDWSSLGGFDLKYFMYGEEADLCLRARKLGAQPRITPQAEIVHYVGESSKVRSRKQVMILKAKMTLIGQYFPAIQKPVGKLLLWLWPLSRVFASSILAGVTKKQKWKDTRDSWRDVWGQRSDWVKGYAPISKDGQ